MLSPLHFQASRFSPKFSGDLNQNDLKKALQDFSTREPVDQADIDEMEKVADKKKRAHGEKQFNKFFAAIAGTLFTAFAALAPSISQHNRNDTLNEIQAILTETGHGVIAEQLDEPDYDMEELELKLDGLEGLTDKQKKELKELQSDFDEFQSFSDQRGEIGFTIATAIIGVLTALGTATSAVGAKRDKEGYKQFLGDEIAGFEELEENIALLKELLPESLKTPKAWPETTDGWQAQHLPTLKKMNRTMETLLVDAIKEKAKETPSLLSVLGRLAPGFKDDASYTSMDSQVRATVKHLFDFSAFLMLENPDVSKDIFRQKNPIKQNDFNHAEMKFLLLVNALNQGNVLEVVTPDNEQTDGHRINTNHLQNSAASFRKNKNALSATLAFLDQLEDRKEAPQKQYEQAEEKLEAARTLLKQLQEENAWEELQNGGDQSGYLKSIEADIVKLEQDLELFKKELDLIKFANEYYQFELTERLANKKSRKTTGKSKPLSIHKKEAMDKALDELKALIGNNTFSETAKLVEEGPEGASK